MLTPIQTKTTTAHPTYDATYVWMISLVAALGGLLFGYDWVVIGGAKPFYEKFFRLYDPAQQGWAMSCALVGCLLGAMLSGVLTDKFGRKPMLLLSGMLFALSSIGIALSNTFDVFVTWRIAGGLAIGLASSLSPMYIAEVSPPQFRGKLVSINQLTVVIGILLAQLVNWLIARPVSPTATAADILNSWNGQVGWRWMFGVTAIPATLFFIGTFMIPESPRWLAAKGATDKAQTILARIGGTYSDQALAEIKATVANKKEEFEFKRLLEPSIRKPLQVGIVLAVFQQWCGINVIFNYAEEVFSAAGFKVSDILFNIVVTGAVNLVFTFVAMGLVDKLGRRPLMLTGAGGLTLIYIALGYAYHAHIRGTYTLILVVAAIACYAMSLAPVTWVVISEIFPNRARGVAVSIAVSTLWIASFVLTYTFPRLNHNLGAAGTFWIYALVCAFGFGFIKLRLPETRGKTLEDIEASWAR
jgi:SP family arabinose:H+ symporter-like MFS transporter